VLSFASRLSHRFLWSIQLGRRSLFVCRFGGSDVVAQSEVQLNEALEASMGQCPDALFEGDIEDATEKSETVVVLGQQWLELGCGGFLWLAPAFRVD